MPRRFPGVLKPLPRGRVKSTSAKTGGTILKKTAFQSKMLRHHGRNLAQKAALSGLTGGRMTKTQAKTYLRLERKIRRDRIGRFA